MEPGVNQPMCPFCGIRTNTPCVSGEARECPHLVDPAPWDLPKGKMMKPPASDPVHLPHHYARFKIEPIRFIMENNLPFEVGNVVKYVVRADAKNGIEDLKKARRYLDMMIAKAEAKEDWWK